MKFADFLAEVLKNNEELGEIVNKDIFVKRQDGMQTKRPVRILVQKETIIIEVSK